MFDTCLAKLYLNADLKLHLVQSNQSALSVLLGFGDSSLDLHTLHKNTQVWDVQKKFTHEVLAVYRMRFS